MANTFNDLVVHIRPARDDCYAVEATLSDGSVYQGEFVLAKEQQQKLRARELNPVEYGKLLFALLFQGQIGVAYAVANGLARKQSADRLRIRLLMDNNLPAAVPALKWERLCEPGQRNPQPLAIGDLTPLSRHSALPREEPIPLDVPYVNLLIVVSSPSDLAGKGLAEIDVAGELRRLIPALQEVLGSRRCRVTIMPGRKGTELPEDLLDALQAQQCEVLVGLPATLNAISERLRNQHVLHYLGHGQYVQGTGALFLEAEDGTMAVAAEDELVARLSNSQLQMVFLAACDSARRDATAVGDDQPATPGPGLAAALVSAGIPAVHLCWWEETVVFVCGLLASSEQADASRCLRRLLEPLVFGTNLLENEAVFLAARCLIEWRQHEHKQVLPDLVAHVVDALRWRTDSSNEPDWQQRLRATQFLARLAAPDVTIQLARVAYDKVRKNAANDSDYEFSTIRFTAATVLKRMSRDARAAVLEAINPQLPALFEAWNEKDAAAVIKFSELGDDDGVQGIAALALGDLHGRLQDDATGAQLVFARLCDMFLDANVSQCVRWPVADALAGLDLNLVTEKLIGPLFTRLADDADAKLRRPEKIRKTLAYLIGQMRMNEASARTFLLEECLEIKSNKAVHDWSTWATAVGALGRIADQSDVEVLVELAGGSLRGTALRQLFPDPMHQMYLVHEAIAALASFGNLDLLKLQTRDELAGNPAFTRVYYRTVQSMYWRGKLRLPPQ